MAPRLNAGDFLLVNLAAYRLKWPFAKIPPLPTGSISRGDLVVFHHPEKNEDFVKRVVGIGGDRIRIDSGVVILNGKQRSQAESDSQCESGYLCFAERFSDTTYNSRYLLRPAATLDWSWPADGKDYAIPTGSVFVLGDNRDFSSDSRDWYDLPTQAIVGKVLWAM